jgi:hypothetical protein
MSLQRVEKLLGGQQRTEVMIPLAEVAPVGNYAVGDSLAEIALGNFGLPLRHFLIQENRGLVRMRWWELSANGWEYPEPEGVALDVASPIFFANTGSVYSDGFRDGSIRSQKLERGIYFEPEQILFGINLREDSVLQMVTPNEDIDGRVTYFSEFSEQQSDLHIIETNALGIDEVFLAALTSEQASQYIKAVYRKMSQFFHPDTGSGSVERMQKINADAQYLHTKYAVR